MSGKIKFIKHLYNLFTGRQVKHIEQMVRRQDQEVEVLCATMDGDKTWMLERPDKDQSRQTNDEGGQCF